MKQFPTWRLDIVGHTDAAGEPAQNEALSRDRADAVKAALVQRGIEAGRLVAQGVGEASPSPATTRPMAARSTGASSWSARTEAQHPVHHGRRHRLHAAVDLPSRPDGRRDAQHRPDRPRRGDVHRLLCRAELHRRAQRLLHRHAPAAHGHDPAAAAGQPELPAARHAGDRQVPARPRLQHRRVRQEPSGRPHRRAADRARVRGVLGLPLPSGRHAGGELPRHQQEPDRADVSSPPARTRRSRACPRCRVRSTPRPRPASRRHAR